jgi:hypothetical protein
VNTLRDAVTALAAINTQQLRADLDNLEAIRDWAMDQLGVDYKPGDRVTIISDEPSNVSRDSGWWHYREALAPGQTGIAEDITFNAHTKRWGLFVAMDRTWSVLERDHHGRDGITQTVTRRWNGPAHETPDGYEPPSQHNQEKHPKGRVKLFRLDVTWLTKAHTQTPGHDHVQCPRCDITDPCPCCGARLADDRWIRHNGTPLILPTPTETA